MADTMLAAPRLGGAPLRAQRLGSSRSAVAVGGLFPAPRLTSQPRRRCARAQRRGGVVVAALDPVAVGCAVR